MDKPILWTVFSNWHYQGPAHSEEVAKEDGYQHSLVGSPLASRGPLAVS